MQYIMMDINCDMGEGIGNEMNLMPYITSANIACGYHAGDENTMQEVIGLCLEHQVHIGAHPSFADRENFGRRTMELDAKAIHQLIYDQLLNLNKVAGRQGAKLHHIKPHGALYNLAARDRRTAQSIVNAVKAFDESLVVYGLSGSVFIDEAGKMGLQTAHEVFADRTYQDDGSLTPRDLPNAVLTTKEAVLEQVTMIMREQAVATTSGRKISLKADTICLHGDTDRVVELAKAVYDLIYGKQNRK